MSSVVIRAGARFLRSAPVLVLTDLQEEHALPGRRYSIPDADPVRSACRRVLAAAREAGSPVAHFRRLERSSFFNPAAGLAAWLEELRPHPGEMVFEHDRPSCYSSDMFARFFEHVRDPLIMLAGFGANYTGLATAIDAFTRGHRMWLIRDASGSYGLGGGATHQHVCGVIAQFAEVVSMADVIELLLAEAPHFGERCRG